MARGRLIDGEKGNKDQAECDRNLFFFKKKRINKQYATHQEQQDWLADIPPDIGGSLGLLPACLLPTPTVRLTSIHPSIHPHLRRKRQNRDLQPPASRLNPNPQPQPSKSLLDASDTVRRRQLPGSCSL